MFNLFGKRKKNNKIDSTTYSIKIGKFGDKEYQLINKLITDNIYSQITHNKRDIIFYSKKDFEIAVHFLDSFNTYNNDSFESKGNDRKMFIYTERNGIPYLYYSDEYIGNISINNEQYKLFLKNNKIYGPFNKDNFNECLLELERHLDSNGKLDDFKYNKFIDTVKFLDSNIIEYKGDKYELKKI